MENFKPILFSTPMVQAILEGRKTQTRRQIKFELNNIHYVFGMPKENIKLLADWSLSGIDKFEKGILSYYVQCDVDDSYEKEIKCPYEIGTILWVRETWGLNYFGSSNFWHLKEGIRLRKGNIVYKADDEKREKRFLLNQCWKPSIFMPKEAARTFLKVTNIRVERLQDISESDAICEGVENYHNHPDLFKNYNLKNDDWLLYARNSFMTLWQKINGNWDENPFVWVYDFERIEKPLNFNL